ncbi:pyridoxal phosphate-dependent aminotransferase [Plantactinospora sp. WMMB334]|uniref:pyridoxal phosphate-dependent aminotransferase n=1 Tax=Plantactinospora sp. WMMB334 TaxID=3404119 RepID=UPI003B93A7F0
MTGVEMSSTARRPLPDGVVDLAAGDVRLPFPHPDGVSRTIGPADQAYADTAGDPDLRSRIAAYATGTAPVTAGQVLVTPGARTAVFLTLLQATGRDVLLPVPHWGSYPALVQCAGAHPVDYGPYPEVTALEAARTSRTAIVVINSPRNPDGAVVDADTVTAVLGWAHQHGIIVLFDQVYRGLATPTTPSPLELTDTLAPHCVVVDGLTKSHAAAGIRLGWAITGDLMPALTAVASHLIGGVSTRTQQAALAALTAPAGTRTAALADLADQVRQTAARLDAIPGVRCPAPDAGFFLFPDLRGWLATIAPGPRSDVTAWLRHEHGVAVVDGAAFGTPGHIRLSAAVDAPTLATGLQRLTAALTTTSAET